MADVGKNAITTITYSGSGSVFIDWPYLDKDYVQVEVDDLLGGGYVVKARGATNDYTIDSLSFLTFNAGKLPPVNALIRLTRVTPHPEPIVEFTARAPVSKDNLERSFKQCLQYTEEVQDLI